MKAYSSCSGTGLSDALRRVIGVIIAASVVFSLWAASAPDVYAATSSSVTKVVITAKQVNIRSGAGTDTEKVGKAYEGQSFNYLGKKKNKTGNLWYKLRYSSTKTGWVSSDYSKLQTGSDNSKTTTTAKAVSTKRVVITASEINIRSGAGIDTEKLGKAGQGQSYEYLGSKKNKSGNIWYQIRFNSKVGWVSSEYSKLETEEPATTTAAAVVTIKQVVVTGNYVYVRSNAGTKYSKLGTAKKGKTFTYITSKKDSSGKLWYNIQYTSAKKGWVLSTFCTVKTTTQTVRTTATTAAAASTDKKQVVVTGNVVNVRSGAGTNYSKLGSVKNGNTFDYLDSKKDSKGAVWYSIQYTPTMKAWIMSEYCTLKTADEAVSTTASTTAQNEKKQVVVTGNVVNVRSDAGTNYSKLGSVKNGNIFDYIDSKKDSKGVVWYSIQYTPTMKAWIMSDYCTLKTAGETVSTTESTTASTTATQKKQVVITGNVVNVRSDAGTNYTKLGTAKSGNVFDYIGSKNDSKGAVWYNIQYTSSKKGWVMGSYAKLQSESDNTTNATSATETTATTQTTATTGTTATNPPEPEKPLDTNVLILSDSLNVRADASASAAKVGKASLGQLCKYLESKKDSSGVLWYKIQLNSSTSGWVTSEYAHMRSEANKNLGVNTDSTRYIKRTVTVTKSKASLRTSLTSSYKNAGTVAKGKKFTALSWGTDYTGTTFYSFRYSGKVVWISSKDVSISDKFTTIPVRTFSDGSNTPVIYLSPSNQTDNAFAVGNTTEQKQMYRVAEALQAILEKEYICEVRIAPLSLPVRINGRAYDAYLCRANVYLAIHSNAGGDKYGIHGAFGYYFPASSQSEQLASSIISEMDKIAVAKSNIKKPLVDGMAAFNGTGYSDIRNPSFYGIPSVLAEVEYHDNATYAQWIINNPDKIARALANSLEQTMSLKKK